MPSPLGDLLGALAAAFEKLSLRWYLFGAQAAIVHGSARLTGDVDATVEVGDVAFPVLVEALEREGFVLRVTNVQGFVEKTRVLPVVHVGSGIPVDVVLAGRGLEEHFLDRARVHSIAGVSVPVASAEDMVIMKVLAGRPKDLEDVAAILAANVDTLDVKHIRETLRLLEEALGQADLLPALDRLLHRER